MPALSLSEDVLVEPEPGLYMIRFGPGRPEVPARIWLCDHEPGNPGNQLDRGGKLGFDAEIAGQPADPYLVMRARERRAIDENEYNFQKASVEWSRIWEPQDPRLRPTRRGDVSKIPPVMP